MQYDRIGGVVAVMPVFPPKKQLPAAKIFHIYLKITTVKNPISF